MIITRHQVRKARSEAVSRRRGFSLIEVLLAVFILGIGVISIAALFPAGIAQQRMSVDDITGPIVAQNALAIVRTKLRSEDFGFGTGYTVDGDFAWRRPAFYFADDPSTPGVDETGAISIFDLAGSADTVSEVVPAPGLTLDVLITQGERYYPMRSQFSNDPFAKPQYVWDCMFRRFQGKVMVAIFVYRTTIVGGGNVAYTVPPNPDPFYPDEPPLPISLDITTSEIWADEGPWDANGNQFIRGTRANEPYNTANQRQSWQEPGQWILDQNNNLHRVLSRVREDVDGDGDPSNDPVLAEMVRPVPTMPVVPVYFLLNTGIQGVDDVVSNIWYIPREVKLDTNGDGQGDLPVRLTPVYVTVREL